MRLSKKEASAKKPREATGRPKSSREVGTRGVGPSKVKNTQKATEPQGAPWAPGSDFPEDNGTNYSQVACSEAGTDDSVAREEPKCVIHNVEEGRLYLEEALLNLGEQLNLDALAGTLVQVSMMEDTPALVSHTVCVVVLILAQMNTEPGKSDNEVDAVSTSLANAVTSKLKAQARPCRRRQY